MGRLDGKVAGAVGLVMLALALVGASVDAQSTRVYRVGIVLTGGAFAAATDGLRDGLKELGLEDGKQVTLVVRDTRGDLKAVETAASALERDGIDLVYTAGSTVTLAAKRATKTVPIVFLSGIDPVRVGLVENFRKPGGRLTGIASQSGDLAAKRLELLRELIPKLRRVAVFYNRDRPAGDRNLQVTRDAARRLKVDLVERQIASAQHLRESLEALRIHEADAIFYVGDSIVASQADVIIETANAKRLPTMLHDPATVVKGALASYGVSYYALGRLSAKHVQRVLLGANPGDLPIEQTDRFHFAVNLKTARALGLTIPQSALGRADQIVE